MRAWAAFRQPTPEAWAHLLKEDLSALPFLRGAVLRMLAAQQPLQSPLDIRKLTPPLADVLVVDRLEALGRP